MVVFGFNMRCAPVFSCAYRILTESFLFVHIGPSCAGHLARGQDGRVSQLDFGFNLLSVSRIEIWILYFIMEDKIYEVGGGSWKLLFHDLRSLPLLLVRPHLRAHNLMDCGCTPFYTKMRPFGRIFVINYRLWLYPASNYVIILEIRRVGKWENISKPVSARKGR
jgi:hypothetical protein